MRHASNTPIDSFSHGTTHRPRLLAASLIVCAVFAAASSHAAAALSEDSCSVLVTKKGEQPALQDAPGLKVLDRRPENPLVISADDGITINAIVCWRSEARFADNDYLVSEAGFPLYVKADFEDEAKNRTVSLERINGSFRIRMLSGPKWSKAEEDEMGQFISLFEAKFREHSDKPSQVVQTGTPEPRLLHPMHRRIGRIPFRRGGRLHTTKRSRLTSPRLAAPGLTPGAAS